MGGSGYFNSTSNIIVVFDLLYFSLLSASLAIPPSSVAYRKLDLLYQVQHIPKHDI